MNPDRIKEDSSEKPKRGRPRLYNGLILLEKLSDARTERGRIEFWHCTHAWGIIKSVWEADPVGNAWAEFYIDKKRKYVYHRAILSALGRIEDKASILEWAQVIAEEKLSTRAAVAAIRRARLGREDRPDFLDLAGSVERALNAYLSAHPSTSLAMVVRALRGLADAIEEDDGKE
jgi:hypothetical protein